jgi:glucose-6-phosphate dehydrogenase assembly protein OpcA
MAAPVNSATRHEWRPSTAAGIEHDLAALWRDVARAHPVARAIMSNLVVVGRARPSWDAEPATEVSEFALDEVARHHPARVILLLQDPEPCGPEASVSASVGVLVFGGEEAPYGVEQIVIRSGCTGEALPSLVRQYILGDLPTSVWWTGDVSDMQPFMSVACMGRQFVYDSQRWRDVQRAVLALTPLITRRERPDFADINWRRLSPLRRAIVSAFRMLPHEPPARVEIRHRRGEEPLACLFAGWLETITSPTVVRAERHRATTANVVIADENLSSRDILTVSFDDQLDARLTTDRVDVRLPTETRNFSVPAPHESFGAAVGAELHTLAHDRGLESVLTSLIQRFRAA